MLNTQYHIAHGSCDICDGLGEVATHRAIGLTLCGDCILPIVTSPRPPTVLFYTKEASYMSQWLRIMGMEDLT